MSIDTPSRQSMYVAAIALVIFSGCDRANNREDLPPTERALATSIARMEKSIDAALEESEDQDQYVVQARHNPGRCGAPNFEVFVRGAWTRAELVTRDQTLGAQIVEFEEDARGQVGAVIVVVGDFNSRPVRSANGTEWPAFQIESIRERRVGEWIERGEDAERAASLACDE